MLLKKITRQLIKIFRGISNWAEYDDSQRQKEPVITAKAEETEPKETVREQIKTVYSVWDYLRFNDNTQAYHLNAVLNYDEWIDMGEIRKRIVELFGVEYKNEKSLYPYVKTLTDVGLIETVSAGGRRRWRKRSILIVVDELEKAIQLLEASGRKKK